MFKKLYQMVTKSKEIKESRKKDLHCKHPQIFTGLGGMGDAKMCRSCGLDIYDDFDIVFKNSQKTPASKKYWPEIEEIRKQREERLNGSSST